jgi:hypothetical protein
MPWSFIIVIRFFNLKMIYMKPYLSLLLTIFLLTSGGVKAQKWRLNTSAGIDNAVGTYAGTTGGLVTARIGAGGGLDLEMNCSPVVSLQLGVHYTQQGFGLANDGDAASIRLEVVTMPLLLRLKATKSLYFLAGPQVGLVIGGQLKSTIEPTRKLSDAPRNIDYYGVLGAGYRFDNNIFIDTRYHYGVNDMSKTIGTSTDIRNRYFSFRVGYSFPLSR